MSSISWFGMGNYVRESEVREERWPAGEGLETREALRAAKGQGEWVLTFEC